MGGRGNELTRSVETVCREYLISLGAPPELTESKAHLHSIIIMILPFTVKKMHNMLGKMP